MNNFIKKNTQTIQITLLQKTYSTPTIYVILLYKFSTYTYTPVYSLYNCIHRID